MIKSARLLLVDDDGDALLSLTRALKAQGFNGVISAASTAERAMELAAKEDPHAAVVDLCLDDKEGVESGFKLIKSLAAVAPFCRVIVLTGHASTAHGIRALNLGAASFLEKPADLNHLLALLQDGVAQSELRRAYEELKTSKGGDEIGRLIIGCSAKMRALVEEVKYASQTGQPVLITGETGTGKGLCAQTIHRLSARNRFKFVRYQPNFSSADLVNSDLFGHRRGAFTGAYEDRRGLIQEAEQGTLFLDEIDELPLETQVTLLGVLQDRKYRPLGSDREQETNFRLICASNQDIEQCLAQGKLRKDFYHRIAYQHIHIPPLREHCEDIKDLACFILGSLREREQVHVFEIEKAAMDRLMHFEWPGNVRQLEAVVESAAYKAQFAGRSSVGEEDLNLGAKAADVGGVGFHDQVQAFKLKLINDALARQGGNQLKAARELGLERSTLRRLLARQYEQNAMPGREER